MQLPADHPQEQARQAALDALGHVNSPAERRFDAITEAAKTALEAPIAVVSLIHNDKQWFKSAQGTALPGAERCISFCAHAILQEEIFEVEDASVHPAFMGNPVVMYPPHVRFYAGIPVRSASRLPLGTLCLLDFVPRKLDFLGRKRLTALGTWLEMELMNRGLSSEELDTLVAQGGGDNESMLDPGTKSWNAEAGKLLLAGKLDRDSSQAEDFLLGCIQLKLEHVEWAALMATVFGEELRHFMANTLRAEFPSGVTFFTMAPDYFFFICPNHDEMAKLPSLPGIARKLRMFIEEQSQNVKTSLFGSYLRNPKGDGRQAQNIMKALIDKTGTSGVRDFVELD